MKIGMNVNKIINVYNNSTKNCSQGTKAVQKGDRIEISTTSKEISKYIEMSKNTEIKNQRVDEIKELLKEGKYKVDSDKLAKSILEHIKGSEK